MIKRRFLLSIIWSLVLFLGVGAQELMAGEPTKPEFTLKLMGINRTLDPWKLYEEWAQSVEKRTNGRVKFELTSLPELGRCRDDPRHQNGGRGCGRGVWWLCGW
jgi:hypothetical protein